MSSVFGARRPGSLLRALVVVGAVVAGTAGPLAAVASAEESTGTTVVGRLVQAVAEAEEPGAEGDHQAWVETAQGAVPVESADVEGVPSGSTVTLDVDGDVTGEPASDPLSVIGTEDVVPPAPAAVLPGPVTNEVSIVLVAPAGTTPDAGVTVGQIAALVGGPVAEFWSAQTGGAVRVGVGPTRDWITTTAGCADARALWAEAAAAVGFVPGPGKHLLLQLSSQTANQPGCSYALAEVGSGPGSGGFLYVREQLTSVIAHELGHNFGLNHSSGVQCDSAVETGACRTAAYRDYYDVMGASWTQLGSLNAPQAARLGVLPADRTAHLGVSDAAGSVTLTPAADPTGVRALRLTDAEGTDYWLEYRAATGQDAWLGRPAENRYRLDGGVQLRRSSSFPDTSVLLDGTPSAAAGWDADLQTSLPVGVPLVLSGGDFTVTVRAPVEGAVTLDVVPSAPAPAVAAAAPRDNGAGRLQPARGAARPQAGTGNVPDSAAPPVQPYVPVPGTAVHTSSYELAPVAQTTSFGGLIVAMAGAGLGAATLIVVQWTRGRGSGLRA